MIFLVGDEQTSFGTIHFVGLELKLPKNKIAQVTHGLLHFWFGQIWQFLNFVIPHSKKLSSLLVKNNKI